MIDDNKERQNAVINNLSKEFHQIAELAKVKVEQIIDYRDHESFELMYSAFNKDEVPFGDKQLLICIVNNKFRKRASEVRDKIFKEAISGEVRSSYSSFNQFIDHTSGTWGTILSNSDLTEYENIKSIQDKMHLSESLQKLFKKHINDPGALRSEFNKILAI